MDTLGLVSQDSQTASPLNNSPVGLVLASPHASAISRFFWVHQEWCLTLFGNGLNWLSSGKVWGLGIQFRDQFSTVSTMGIILGVPAKETSFPFMLETNSEIILEFF